MGNPGWRVKSEDRQTSWGRQRRRTDRLRDPQPAPDAQGLHLSRIRPAAPECGTRGSRGRYKGWAARMSTVRGARGRGPGPVPRGRRRRPAPPSPLPPGVRPAPRRLLPAARGSDTWTPHGSPREASKPGSESWGPGGVRGVGTPVATRVGRRGARAGARGVTAGRARRTALGAGRLPDGPRLRGPPRPGRGVTVPPARAATGGPHRDAGCASAGATEAAQGRPAPRPCAPAGPPGPRPRDKTSQLRAPWKQSSYL